ncbi:WD repeat-containing 5-like [Paramuricea clavata]|uniref:WD repeat-containing 5-like n=1 Tax=Paramuricea clavata TaxID=317549 RepID=A0A6S7HXR3_PARCT|nr:WD repeat-containing 5-like [Paramuricea clavata]
MFLVQNPPSGPSTPREQFVNDVGHAHRYKANIEGSMKILNRIETDSEIMCCRFNPEGNLLAVGLVNGVTKIYTVEPLSCVYVLPAEDTGGQPLPVTCLRWRPNIENQNFKNILLATYASGSVKIWHVSTMDCLSSTQEGGRQVLACAFNASALQYITAGSDTTINLYDATTRQKLLSLEPSTSFLVMDGHMMRIFSVMYLPNDDHVFLSGGWDDTLQWWDSRVDSRHSIKRIFGPHICGDALDILPSNSNILTGSWRKDNSVQIWDFNSGELIRDVPDDFNRSMTYCTQWLPDGQIIAGGSDMNMLRMLEQSSTSTVTIGRMVDLPRAVYTVDNDRSGPNPRIAVGSSNSIYIVQRS